MALRCMAQFVGGETNYRYTDKISENKIFYICQMLT